MSATPTNSANKNATSRRRPLVAVVASSNPDEVVTFLDRIITQHPNAKVIRAPGISEGAQALNKDPKARVVITSHRAEGGHNGVIKMAQTVCSRKDGRCIVYTATPDHPDFEPLKETFGPAFCVVSQEGGLPQARPLFDALLA